MSVTDRLRAATDAMTGAMRPVRPLDLPPVPAADPAPARPGKARRPRRWPGWLVPVAAAVSVVAVAAALVAVRNLPGASPASPAEPAPAGSSADGGLVTSAPIPRYFAAIRYPATHSGSLAVVVGDDKTGRTLATFTEPKGQRFGTVVAGPGRRTFVLSSTLTGKSPTIIWYLLRITPGASRPVTMTRLPMELPSTTGPGELPLPVTDPRVKSAFVKAAPGPTMLDIPRLDGFAVSPNGQELAVLYDRGGLPGGLALRTYSMSTGATLHTWDQTLDQVTHPATEYVAPQGNAITWLADGHHVAFYLVWAVRTLDTTRPGTNLDDDSKLVFRQPKGCYRAILVPDGKTVLCTNPSVSDGSPATPHGCGEEAYAFEYSVATGKQLTALKPPACFYSGASPAWVNASGSTFIIRSNLQLTDRGKITTTLIVDANGHLTQYPAPFPLLDPAFSPWGTGIAFAAS